MTKRRKLKFGLLVTETARLEDLRPHPRNYRQHPEDQLAHIAQSLREHGLYRNVVVGRDNTILAGHGVVLAARKLGWRTIQVARLPLGPEDPRALKLLAEIDDRALTELLREVKNTAEDGLLGTGFDDKMLAALLMVTRPASEIRDFDAAAAWVGMPTYGADGQELPKLVITFPDARARDRFIEKHEIRVDKQAIKGLTMSTRWPWSEREDAASVRFRGRQKR